MPHDGRSNTVTRLRGDPKPVVLVKMHGAHNTFVLVDERSPREAVSRRPTAMPNSRCRLCAVDGPLDGADGLLILRDAKDDATMALRVFNADGSEAEMCGNGVRCVARYLFDRGEGQAFSLSTSAGRIGARVTARAPFAVAVDMGPVVFPNGAREETLDVLGATWRFYDVSVGNPHAVIFGDAIAKGRS